MQGLRPAGPSATGRRKPCTPGGNRVVTITRHLERTPLTVGCRSRGNCYAIYMYHVTIVKYEMDNTIGMEHIKIDKFLFPPGRWRLTGTFKCSRRLGGTRLRQHFLHMRRLLASLPSLGAAAPRQPNTPYEGKDGHTYPPRHRQPDTHTSEPPVVPSASQATRTRHNPNSSHG